MRVGKRSPLIIVSILLISFFIIYFSIPHEQTTSFFNNEVLTINLYSDHYFVVVSCIATIFLFLTYKLYGFKSTQGKVWLTLSVGVFCWFLGEFLWTLYQVYMGIDPFPSMADAFFLGGYLFLYLSIYYPLKFFKTPNKTKIIVSAMIGLVYMILSTIFVLKPIFEYEDYSFAEKFFALSYPIADMILVIGSLLILGKLWGGRVSITWLLISLAFLCSGLADTIFSYADWNKIYETNFIIYTITDFIWIVRYLLFIVASGYEKAMIKKG